MEFYVLIYAILLLLSMVEVFSGSSLSLVNKKRIILIISFAFIFLSTIYNGIMGDAVTYKYYFLSDSNLSHLTNISGNHFEYLYEVVSALTKQISNSYVLLRFVLATITMLLWYKVYTYFDDNYVQSFALTIIFIVWCLNFGNIFVIRSTLATSICAYSLRYIEKKDLKKFLLCVAIATGFHTVGIVWLPAYWIYQYPKIKKYIYTAIGIAVVGRKYINSFVLWITSLMGGRIYHSVSTYIGYGAYRTLTNYDAFFSTVKAMANIVLLVIVFELIIFIKKKNNELSNEENLYNLFLTGAFIQILAYGSNIILARAALIYNFTQYLLLPRIFDIPSCRKNIGNRFIIFFVFSVYLWLRMYFNVKSAWYIPFTTIFG